MKKNGAVRKYEENGELQEPKFVFLLLALQPLTGRLQNQNPGWTALYGLSRKKVLAKTIHG